MILRFLGFVKAAIVKKKDVLCAFYPYAPYAHASPSAFQCPFARETQPVFIEN